MGLLKHEDAGFAGGSLVLAALIGAAAWGIYTDHSAGPSQSASAENGSAGTEQAVTGPTPTGTESFASPTDSATTSPTDMPTSSFATSSAPSTETTTGSSILGGEDTGSEDTGSEGEDASDPETSTAPPAEASEGAVAVVSLKEYCKDEKGNKAKQACKKEYNKKFGGKKHDKPNPGMTDAAAND